MKNKYYLIGIALCLAILTVSLYHGYSRNVDKTREPSPFFVSTKFDNYYYNFSDIFQGCTITEHKSITHNLTIRSEDVSKLNLSLTFVNGKNIGIGDGLKYTVNDVIKIKIGDFPLWSLSHSLYFTTSNMLVGQSMDYSTGFRDFALPELSYGDKVIVPITIELKPCEDEIMGGKWIFNTLYITDGNYYEGISFWVIT